MQDLLLALQSLVCYFVFNKDTGISFCCLYHKRLQEFIYKSYTITLCGNISTCDHLNAGVSTGPAFGSEFLLSDRVNTNKPFGNTNTTFDSTGAFGWINNSGADESDRTTGVETLGERCVAVFLTMQDKSQIVIAIIFSSKFNQLIVNEMNYFAEWV